MMMMMRLYQLWNHANLIWSILLVLSLHKFQEKIIILMKNLPLIMYGQMGIHNLLYPLIKFETKLCTLDGLSQCLHQKKVVIQMSRPATIIVLVFSSADMKIAISWLVH